MDPALLIAVRLGKEGFGAPQLLLKSPSRIVLAMLAYSNFSGEFQETATELNREEARA